MSFHANYAVKSNLCGLKAQVCSYEAFMRELPVVFFSFSDPLWALKLQVAHEKAPNELFHCDDICVWEEYLATCMRTFDKFSRLYNSNTRVGCSKANSIFMRWIVIFLAFKCVK